MSSWILELAVTPDREVRYLESALETEGWEVYLTCTKTSVETVEESKKNVDKLSWHSLFGGYLLLTDDAARARKAAEEQLPVIYYERPGSAAVYEADVTVLGLKELDSVFFKRTFQRHYGIPWMIAETPRLLIRESTAEDFEGLMKLYEDPDTRMELYRDQMASGHFEGKDTWGGSSEKWSVESETCGEGSSRSSLAEKLIPDQEAEHDKLLTLSQESEHDKLLTFNREAECRKLLTADQETEREKLQAYIHNQYPYYGYGLYTVIGKESGETVARIGFENRTYQGKQYLELGYLVGHAYRNQGIALEASLALADVMEELTGERSAGIFCRSDNLPSRRVAEKLCRLRPDRFYLILVN